MRKRREKMGRAPCCEKDQVKKGAWTTEEDKILVDYITNHGHGTWRSLPKLAGLLRCGKSCRLRWTNYLRPDIKRGPFTPEEETTIVQLHGILGNKWAAIASHIPGRTDNEIKNFWNSHLKKRLSSMGHNPFSHSMSTVVNIKTESPSTRHLAQWENARVEAEARLSTESFLNSSSASETNSDHFLRLWNSEVGDSFRKINEQDGVVCQSQVSNTSSSTKDGSGSGVTLQEGYPMTSSSIDTGEKQKSLTCMSSGKEADDMMAGSDTSNSYELDDSSDITLKLLLDFPSGNDMGFLQEHMDDVSIYQQGYTD